MFAGVRRLAASMVRRRLESVAERVAAGPGVGDQRTTDCPFGGISRHGSPRPSKRLRGSPQRGGTQLEFRCKLEGTEVLRAFNRYLEDYGHRGVGESDVMSPRFADRPELLLAVLRTQILAPTSATPADILQRQTVVRERALAEIRARFGWRFHRWAIFSWWYRRLCRFFALREANRHHLMYYSAAGRSLLLRLGEWLVEQGATLIAGGYFLLQDRRTRGLVSRRIE